MKKLVFAAVLLLTLAMGCKKESTPTPNSVPFTGAVDSIWSGTYTNEQAPSTGNGAYWIAQVQKTSDTTGIVNVYTYPGPVLAFTVKHLKFTNPGTNTIQTVSNFSETDTVQGLVVSVTGQAILEANNWSNPWGLWLTWNVDGSGVQTFEGNK